MRLGDWVRQLRLHQWAKNLLLLVPAFASFKLFTESVLASSMMAFLAFGLVASAVYVFNDYVDLGNDREHPIKKSRPMAAGKIPAGLGLAVAITFLVVGLALAALVGLLFLDVLLGYLALNAIYSFWLKKVTLIDCLLLAGLYTLRVVAGGIASGIAISFWLLTFSVFFFLSIAWVKRYAELEAARSAGAAVAPGRGYSVSDMPLILAFGSASAFIAVLVFALYLDSEAVRLLYATPQIAWMAIPMLMYVIGRMWFKAHRGAMNEDPILFLIKDFASILALVLLVVVLIAAHLGVSL